MNNDSGTNGTTSSPTYTKQQIQQCQEIVKSFRVHELHQLLSIFHYPKLGKKVELVDRAQAVLSIPKHQTKAAQKVFEIQVSNRVRDNMHPYSPTGNINGSMQQQHGVHHQQQSYPAVGGGPLPTAAPPASSPSVIAGGVGGGGMLHPGSNAAAAAGMARAPTFNHHTQQQQQMFNNQNAAAFYAAYQHQFFQMAPHNFVNPQAAHLHHQQPPNNPLAAAASAAAAAAAAAQQHHQPQHHHQQQNGQAAQQQQHVHPNLYQRQQQQQPAVVPQHGAGGQSVRDLRTVELPFYDQIKVIVPMTELPPYPVPIRPGDARASHSFSVPSEDIQRVHYRIEEQPLPRYELQLRMFLLETSEEQQDAFPPGSTVRVDEHGVQLPPVIPTNKPNAEQKRYPRPVNITPYAQPPRGRSNPHRLSFEWNGDKRAWAFTVTLVRRLNSEILLNRILNNPNARRPLEKTKQIIVRRLNGDEDDVQMDSLKISLMDPLMRTRIKIPSRAAECTHLQCFDLNSYLMMSEKRPTWKCPVCDRNAIYSKLIIDAYFEQVLSAVASGDDEIELLRDGSWRLPLPPDTMGVDSDDQNDGVAAAGGDEGGAGTAEASAGGDDDDDIMVVTMPVAKKQRPPGGAAGASDTVSCDLSAKQQSSAPVQQQQQKRPTSSSASAVAPTPDIDIICLSSDDEEEDRQQMARAIAASSRQQQQQQQMFGAGSAENGKEMARGNSSGGGEGCAAGTSSSSSSASSNGGGAAFSYSVSSSSSSVNTNSSAASTTAKNGRRMTVLGAVPEATGDTAARNAGDRSRSAGSSVAPPTANNGPILRVNGMHPSIFRPAINEVATRHIASNLAVFLQHVNAKNSRA
ncbi:hypothetical protein niasHT_013740 [Heterodera trifolii]|uniref:Uncharacterized protein n=1 Tax=Heterodera trifolii TaxID=157864 RepID=A0ABD2LE60_9BILA